MWSELFNFTGINWWTLLGGIGLNFIITMVASLFGAYLQSSEATAEVYKQLGPPGMVVAVFACCLGAGWTIGA